MKWKQTLLNFLSEGVRAAWKQRSRTLWLGSPGGFGAVSTMCGPSRWSCHNTGRVVSSVSRSCRMCVFKMYAWKKPVLRSHLSLLASCKTFLCVLTFNTEGRRIKSHIRICESSPKLFLLPWASAGTRGKLGDRSRNNIRGTAESEAAGGVWGFICKQRQTSGKCKRF